MQDKSPVFKVKGCRSPIHNYSDEESTQLLRHSPPTTVNLQCMGSQSSINMGSQHGLISDEWPSRSNSPLESRRIVSPQRPPTEVSRIVEESPQTDPLPTQQAEIEPPQFARRLFNRESLNRESEGTRTLKKRSSILQLNSLISQINSGKGSEKKDHCVTGKQKSSASRILPETNSPASCSICYLNYEGGLPTGVLKCGHGFCYSCIWTWSHHSNLCPLCKEKFTVIMHHTEQGELVETIPVEEPVFLEREDIDPDNTIVEESSSITEPNPDPRLASADDFCYACNLKEEQDVMLVCDHCCKKGCHIFCLRPALKIIPDAPWYCDYCVHKFKIRTTLPTARVIRSKRINKKKTQKLKTGEVLGRIKKTLGKRKRKISNRLTGGTRNGGAPLGNQNDLDNEITSDEEFDVPDDEDELASDDEEEEHNELGETSEEEDSASEDEMYMSSSGEGSEEEDLYGKDSADEDYEECERSDNFIVTDPPRQKRRKIHLRKPGLKRSKVIKVADVYRAPKFDRNEAIKERKRLLKGKAKENFNMRVASKYIIDIERNIHPFRRRLVKNDTSYPPNYAKAMPTATQEKSIKKFRRLKKVSEMSPAIRKKQIFEAEEEDSNKTRNSNTVLTRRMKQQELQQSSMNQKQPARRASIRKASN